MVNVQTSLKSKRDLISEDGIDEDIFSDSFITSFGKEGGRLYWYKIEFISVLWSPNSPRIDFIFPTGLFWSSGHSLISTKTFLLIKEELALDLGIKISK